jgi:RNA polymerase sigma-70 factor (ECF subfamily)
VGAGYGRGEEWFNEVYSAYYPYIFRYCHRRLNDADTSVELAQDVFVVAWRRRTEVSHDCLPWLYQVARRLLANHRRASQAAPRTVPLSDADILGWRSDAGGTGQESAAAIADIRTALATLPDLYQEILRLVGWEELTAAEAAIVLGCSRTTASVRLYRARRLLLAALAAKNHTTEKSTRTMSPAGDHRGGKPDV